MSNETNNASPEKWVNIEDVAEHLSMREDTVRTWVREGKLPCIKVGKRYKFKLSEIDEHLRNAALSNADKSNDGDDEQGDV